MSRLLLLCAALVLGSAASAQISPPPAALQQQIGQMLHEMDTAANSHDTDRYMGLFQHTDGLVFIINGRVIHGWNALRDQQQKWWLDGKTDVVYTPQGDPEFMILTSDLAVITRRFTSTRSTPDGGTSRAEFAVSMIWRNTPQGWRIVYGHESRTR